MDAGTALALRVILAIGLGWALTFIVGRRLFRLDIRGAGVVGGVCAGIALGPMVLGRVAPGFYETTTTGGVTLRESIADQRALWALDLAALQKSGVSEEAIYDATRRAEYRLRSLEQRFERELHFFRDFPLAVGSSLGLVAVMLGAMRVRGVSIDGVRIGVIVTLLAALVWAVVARRLVGVELGLAAVFGAVLAGGSVWCRGRWRMGFGLAGVCIAFGLLVAGDATGAAWRVVAAVAMGLVVGRVLRWGTLGERRAAWVAHGLLVPSVAALMVSSCDLADAPSGALVLVLIAVALGTDFHFVAAFVAFGCLGRGWRRRRPMTAWFNAHAQGWAGTQIVVANLVMAFGLMEREPEIAGVLGLAAAGMALSAELTRPATYKSLVLMRRVKD